MGSTGHALKGTVMKRYEHSELRQLAKMASMFLGPEEEVGKSPKNKLEKMVGEDLKNKHQKSKQSNQKMIK